MKSVNSMQFYGKLCVKFIILTSVPNWMFCPNYIHLLYMNFKMEVLLVMDNKSEKLPYHLVIVFSMVLNIDS